MGDRAQINIVVDIDRKKQWEQVAEENPEYESLSHLIRLSVLRELNRDEYDNGSTDVDFTQVEDRFDSLEARLDELSSNVRRLVAEQEQEDVSELTNKVYEIIPRITDEETWQARLHDGNTGYVEHEAGGAPETAGSTINMIPDPEGGWKGERNDTDYEIVVDQYQTIANIADELDESEYRTRLAVQRVEESFARVKTYDYDGDTYVYEVN